MIFFTKKEIGDFGENLAEKFLKKKKKYKILGKNWRHGHGEIDIIALDDEVIVFVEVRTRKSDALVPGYFSISKNKKEVLKATCYAYVAENKILYYRFDVVEIDYNLESSEIFHYENIPLF